MRRGRFMCVAFALVIVAACGRIGFDAPDAGERAAGGSSVECGPGAACDVSIDSASALDVLCAPGEVCHVACAPASSCRVDCNGATTCIVQCPPTACTVTHCNGGCTVTCNDVRLASRIDETATCP